MSDIVALLHYELIRGLVEHAALPGNSQLASTLGLSVAQVEATLQSLADLHGVVLHPHAIEPWIVHPFSATPTLNWIAGRDRGWWTPCMWCGLGVTTLVGGETRIHTRFGAEGEPLVIDVVDGEPVGRDDIWVHFAIPPARAWNNVHQHCSMVLPFHSESEIQAWCERHRLPRGEAVPLHQVAKLAAAWYGSHDKPTWHKWSVGEAQKIFHGAGLTSSFWDLGVGSGRY